MKKIVAVALSVVMVMAIMCAPVSALNLDNKLLRPQVWLQDTASWSWQECREEGATEAPLIALGETRDVVLTDFSSFEGMNTSAGFNYGFQICDETLSTTEAGESSTIGFTISDMVFKAEGYDDIVVPIAGDYEKSLTTVQYDWGVGDNNANFNNEVTAAISAVVGTNGADIYNYFQALTSVSYTITYTSYNGEKAEGAAPAETETETATETATEAEADTAPETETAAPAAETTTPAPSTGIALAVIPAVVAMAAAVVSKKH